jgi:hypothetical protein
VRVFRDPLTSFQKAFGDFYKDWTGGAKQQLLSLINSELALGPPSVDVELQALIEDPSYTRFWRSNTSLATPAPTPAFETPHRRPDDMFDHDLFRTPHSDDMARDPDVLHSYPSVHNEMSRDPDVLDLTRDLTSALSQSLWSMDRSSPFPGFHIKDPTSAELSDYPVPLEVPNVLPFAASDRNQLSRPRAQNQPASRRR